jgi:hypothetical protein
LETRYFAKKGELERTQREQQEINGGGSSKLKTLTALSNAKKVYLKEFWKSRKDGMKYQATLKKTEQNLEKSLENLNKKNKITLNEFQTEEDIYWNDLNNLKIPNKRIITDLENQLKIVLKKNKKEQTQCQSNLDILKKKNQKALKVFLCRTLR